MAYRTQNGVRTPTTSAGSNQAGAKVTYNAQRISPSGLVCAAVGSGRPPASRRESTISHARASLDVRCMLSSSPDLLEQGDVTHDHLRELSYRVRSRKCKSRRGALRIFLGRCHDPFFVPAHCCRPDLWPRLWDRRG